VFETTEKELTKMLNSAAKVSDDSLKKEIKTITNLLSINEADFVKSLTSRLIATGSKDLVNKELTIADATYARDALAKVFYILFHVLS
jgi:myosin heavy subunit